MKGKVWQQRLSRPLHPAIHALNRSLDYDRRLWPYDLQVSRVWVQALERAGLLSAGELLAISGGLESIREELAAGKFAFSDDDEDIHMAIERRLEELIGSAANKLHTGRSRNDQVATDLHLFCRESGEQVSAALREVIAVLVVLAEAQASQPFPGHTHLQQAEVLSLGHILLAHATALRSDTGLLERTASDAMAACPLGAGALGGSPVAVDRHWIATELGFAAPAPNSIEAVSSRDCALDLLYALSRLGVHLSRLAEDVILWSSIEFGYATLDDATATGSSLLAHKKNPDVFELARGKSGRLIGHLTGLLTTIKGLPGGYNKDLQEDKEPLFDSVDTALGLLAALKPALEGLTFHSARIVAALSPQLKAQRLVAYLVGKGLAFRQAYGVAGALVSRAEKEGVALEALDLDVFQEESELFGADVLELLHQPWVVPDEGVYGGSSVKSVQEQIKELQGWLG
ncbi:MAG: argininosuccinate lyase [Candidatus Marinimicrobia bacterium]|nr:argininosuccinate lyase [Candidatus Neomarinimicrobiota bacterium]